MRVQCEVDNPGCICMQTKDMFDRKPAGESRISAGAQDDVMVRKEGMCPGLGFERPHQHTVKLSEKVFRCRNCDDRLVLKDVCASCGKEIERGFYCADHGARA